MDLRDCYNSFGGDFDEVLGRLRRVNRLSGNLFINFWMIKVLICLKRL